AGACSIRPRSRRRRSRALSSSIWSAQCCRQLAASRAISSSGGGPRSLTQFSKSATTHAFQHEQGELLLAAAGAPGSQERSGNGSASPVSCSEGADLEPATRAGLELESD